MEDITNLVELGQIAGNLSFNLVMLYLLVKERHDHAVTREQWRSDIKEAYRLPAKNDRGE